MTDDTGPLEQLPSLTESAVGEGWGPAFTSWSGELALGLKLSQVLPDHPWLEDTATPGLRYPH